MVIIMVDIPTEVVQESIRRRIEQALDEADAEIERLPDGYNQRIFDYEDLRNLAALNIAMASIIRSVDRN